MTEATVRGAEPGASPQITAPRWRVETRTRASAIAGGVAIGVVALLALAPLYVGRGVIQDLFFILTMLTLAQFWNLLAGYAGLVSVGQQAFVGLGAYALFAAVIIWNVDPVFSILLAGLVAGVLAIPTGFFAFRLQGAYFAIGTWVIAEVARLIIAQWKTLGGGAGASLPRDALRDLVLVDVIKDLLDVKTSAARDIMAYWLALVLAVAVIAGVYWLLRSRLGLGLAAVRDNEQAARSVGVDARRMKALVYFTAAFGAGMTGALIYLQKARISPDAAFSVTDWTAYVIFIVVIGGIGSIEGPIIGVLVFFLLQSLLADYGSIYLFVLGAIGVGVMLVAPKGIWGLISERYDLHLFPVRRRLIVTTGSGGSSPDGSSPDGSSPDGSSPDGSSPDGSSPDGAATGGTAPLGADSGVAAAQAAARQNTDAAQDTKTGRTPMFDLETDVLIVGAGPAGSACAALLATQGVDCLAINRHRWLANTPRAHITNQRTMEVLRDLGREVEDEAMMHAVHQHLMGQNVFCTSLAGEEIGRMRSWGNDPLSKAEHLMASPTEMNDLPQTFMEPILFKTACSRGAQSRMSTEYLSHSQDADGVLTRCRDRLSGREFTVRSKYLVGADGGRSLVAEHAGLPFEGQMGVAGSMNIIFKADLSKYVAHRPSVLYWVVQPEADVGGIGMGLVRMVRTWDEWLIVWGYDIEQAPPEVDEAFAKRVAHQLIGDDSIQMEITSVSTWTVNNMYATRLSEGRVFCMGDAVHRHPPSNGLGSNTSIQDAFNLAWKLAMVVKGQAGPKLLDSYNAERAPVAKQIVTRANKSIDEFGPIFQSLGLLETKDPHQMQANMDKRLENTPQGEAQRAEIRRTIAAKVYEFDAHGVEMNQRYVSGAIAAEGQPEPPFARDPELHYHPTTWPGARLPHAWVFRGDAQLSTLDLAGKGRFSLFTGIGGEAWIEAAREVGAEFGIEIAAHKVGPQCDIADHAGDWARLSEVRDSGVVLVRPDQHVCWRRETAAGDAAAELRRALSQVLAR